MAARDVRKNVTLWVDSKGLAGQIEDFTAPVLAMKTEEFRGGGMNAAVELSMGMEKLESSFNLIAYDRDVLALFGVASGNFVSLIAREVLESFDGTVTAVEHVIRGRLRKLDPGTTKAGDKAALNAEMAVTYYKLKHGATVVQEIDVENMIHKVNGVDVLAQQRAALGI